MGGSGCGSSGCGCGGQPSVIYCSMPSMPPYGYVPVQSLCAPGYAPFFGPGSALAQSSSSPSCASGCGSGCGSGQSSCSSSCGSSCGSGCCGLGSASGQSSCSPWGALSSAALQSLQKYGVPMQSFAVPMQSLLPCTAPPMGKGPASLLGSAAMLGSGPSKKS